MERINRIVEVIKSLTLRQRRLVDLVNKYEERIKMLETSSKENRRIIQNQDRLIRNHDRSIRQLKIDFNSLRNEISSLKNARR